MWGWGYDGSKRSGGRLIECPIDDDDVEVEDEDEDEEQ